MSRACALGLLLFCAVATSPTWAADVGPRPALQPNTASTEVETIFIEQGAECPCACEEPKCLAPCKCEFINAELVDPPCHDCNAKPWSPVVRAESVDHDPLQSKSESADGGDDGQAVSWDESGAEDGEDDGSELEAEDSEEADEEG